MRASCWVLREAGGEIPPAYSPVGRADVLLQSLQRGGREGCRRPRRCRDTGDQRLVEVAGRNAERALQRNLQRVHGIFRRGGELVGDEGPFGDPADAVTSSPIMRCDAKQTPSRISRTKPGARNTLTEIGTSARRRRLGRGSRIPVRAGMHRRTRRSRPPAAPRTTSSRSSWSPDWSCGTKPNQTLGSLRARRCHCRTPCHRHP